jgi:hypothetical protein
MARLRRESSRSYSGRPVLSGTAATPGAATREGRCGSTGVSRGHSTGSHEPGNTPDGLTTREGLNLADSTTIAGRRLAMKPTGRAWPRASVAEKECCSILRDCQEPPDADPHVRWCGSREVNPPGDPISAINLSISKISTQFSTPPPLGCKQEHAWSEPERSHADTYIGNSVTPRNPSNLNSEPINLTSSASRSSSNCRAAFDAGSPGIFRGRPAVPV